MKKVVTCPNCKGKCDCGPMCYGCCACKGTGKLVYEKKGKKWVRIK